MGIRRPPTVIFAALFLLNFHPAHAQTNPTSAQAIPARGPGNKPGAEKLELHVDTSVNLLNASQLPVQEGPSINERSSRGFLLPIIAGYAATKGVQALQKMIENRRNRFIAQYDFAQRDHYFYDQISTVGAFDPAGFRFKGFSIVRSLKDRDSGREDTVFIARFIIDTTDGKCAEIMNNGIFRLRLDSMMITRGRVKAPKDVHELNLDFEINFVASYRADNGQLYADAAMGNFLFTLRNAPIYGKDERSGAYYDSLNRKKPALIGQCFMIPRSAGFYKNKNGVIEACWGKGLYGVKVSVKETSKMKFVDRLIFFSSDPAVNVGGPALQKKAAMAK